MAKFTVWLETNLINSRVTREFEIDDDELTDMSEDDIDDIAKEEMFQLIEWSYERSPE